MCMKRITYDDILKLANGRIEQHNISKENYIMIKNFIHWCIQDNVVLSCNDNINFLKSFICVEFSEGYLIIYHYNPK